MNKADDPARKPAEPSLQGERAGTKIQEMRIPKEVLARFGIATSTAVVGDAQQVLKRYFVNEAEVIIVDEMGSGKYLVREPSVTPEEVNIYKTLMAELFYSQKPSAQPTNTIEFFSGFVDDYAKDPDNTLSEESRKKLLYYIKRDVAGYGLLDVPMNDQNVEEVECGGYAAPITVVQRDFTEYLRLETNIHLSTEEAVGQTVQKLAQRAGKSVTVAYPYADFTLPDGHRGAVTFSNEISLPGSTFDIRKFPADPLTITRLVKNGTISPLMAAYQWLVEENRGFTLITGTVSSGKTTMLNALLSTLHPAAKVFTVEDTPEIRLVHRNWVRFMTRSAYTLGGREVGLFDLVKASLRYRPDYLIVGEVRGEEIQSLVQAAAVGHGALTTIHAESPEAALVRMRSPPLSVGESFIMLIWSFLQMGRITMPDGKQSRRALSITELVPDQKAVSFHLRPIFAWDPQTDTFSPEEAQEVVRRSERLKTIMALRGWTQAGIIDELNTRAETLQGLLDNNLYNYKEVAASLFAFYRRNRGI